MLLQRCGSLLSVLFGQVHREAVSSCSYAQVERFVQYLTYMNYMHVHILTLTQLHAHSLTHSLIDTTSAIECFRVYSFRQQVQEFIGRHFHPCPERYYSSMLEKRLTHKSYFLFYIIKIKEQDCGVRSGQEGHHVYIYVRIHIYIYKYKYVQYMHMYFIKYTSGYCLY